MGRESYEPKGYITDTSGKPAYLQPNKVFHNVLALGAKDQKRSGESGEHQSGAQLSRVKITVH